MLNTHEYDLLPESLVTIQAHFERQCGGVPSCPICGPHSRWDEWRITGAGIQGAFPGARTVSGQLVLPVVLFRCNRCLLLMPFEIDSLPVSQK